MLLSRHGTLRAGSLNTRVTIQKPVVGSDSEGSPKTVWATLDIVAAEVEALSAQERVDAAQAQLNITHAVVLRYRQQRDVTHNMRLLFRGRVFEIIDLDYDERNHKWLQVTCREIVI